MHPLYFDDNVILSDISRSNVAYVNGSPVILDVQLYFYKLKLKMFEA